MAGPLATQMAKEPRAHLVSYSSSASTSGANRAGAEALMRVARQLVFTRKIRRIFRMWLQRSTTPASLVRASRRRPAPRPAGRGALLVDAEPLDAELS